MAAPVGNGGESYAGSCVRRGRSTLCDQAQGVGGNDHKYHTEKLLDKSHLKYNMAKQKAWTNAKNMVAILVDGLPEA